MTNKTFDLEERTLNFSKHVIKLINQLVRNTINLSISSQLIRSAGSVGANYREATASLGNKDFLLKIKTCRKEAMETEYWLKMLLENNPDLKGDLEYLIDECNQLIRIFSAIAKKREE